MILDFPEKSFCEAARYTDNKVNAFYPVFVRY